MAGPMPHWALGKSDVTAAAMQVRGGVPIEIERFGRLAGDDLHARVGREREGEIHQPVVDLRGKRRVGQPRRDACATASTGAPRPPGGWSRLEA